MALAVNPAEDVALGILELIHDDSFASRAMKISPNKPPELIDLPNWGVVRE